MGRRWRLAKPLLPPRPCATPFNCSTWKTIALPRCPAPTAFAVPRWSPDGRYLAAEKDSSFDRILLYDFSAQKWRVAVKGIGALGYFAFTRDSKSLLFDSQEVPDPYIYKLRI